VRRRSFGRIRVPAVVLACCAVAIASAPAGAYTIIENDFSGSGSLRIDLDTSGSYYVRCESVTIRGAVSRPANGLAILERLTASACTAIREGITLGSATVAITRLPRVRALSATQVEFGAFEADVSHFSRTGAVCHYEVFPEASYWAYSTGTSNRLSLTQRSTVYTGWDINYGPNPESCPESSIGGLEGALTFPSPQFTVSEGRLYQLRNTNSEGTPDLTFLYQSVREVSLSGDWNADGTDTIGAFRSSRSDWYLRNTNSRGSPDISFSFGNANDKPVVGDWDGDGDTTIGVVRDNEWFLRNTNAGGSADLSFGYGNPSDIPVTGDWDGDGDTTIGVFRSGEWYLANTTRGGFAEIVFGFGNPSDIPVTGDWDGDGDTTIGVYRPSTGYWYLKNSNTGGSADVSVLYRGPTEAAQPVPGDWNANRTSTVGIASD
jgi:hypothetical protein